MQRFFIALMFLAGIQPAKATTVEDLLAAFDIDPATKTIKVKVDGVEALRFYKASSTKTRFGLPVGINGPYPEMECLSDLVQPKCFMRSLFLADPGDTPEVGLQAVGGTYETPTAVGFAGHLGGFIYALHHDGTATTPQGPLVASGVDYSKQYPYLGRSGSIAFPNWQIPSQTARGGGILFETTPQNTVASVQRAFIDPAGGIVSLYRSAYEDTGKFYPWSLAPLAHHERSAPGLRNYLNTPSQGNYTAIMTDRSNGAVFAARKYGDLGTGFDQAYEAATEVYSFDRIVSNTRKRMVVLNPDGSVVLGTSLKANNYPTHVNYVEADGSTTAAPSLRARGTYDDIDLAIIAKGSGKLQFSGWEPCSSCGSVTVTGYFTVKDQSGNTRRIPTF